MSAWEIFGWVASAVMAVMTIAMWVLDVVMRRNDAEERAS